MSLPKQTGRGARREFFRVVFLISLGASFCLASFSCAQKIENTAQKSPAETNAETKLRAANPPRVAPVDDAQIKQLLKPGGKPLLVNFWATWCAPCREEFPDLVKIDAEYRGKIDFITVSLDFVEEINTGVPQFLSEMNAEMPTYLLAAADENAVISAISKDWSGALPFTILYNEKGEVTFLRQGTVNHATLKGAIEKTLGEKNTAK